MPCSLSLSTNPLPAPPPPLPWRPKRQPLGHRPCLRNPLRRFKCSVSLASEPSSLKEELQSRPSAAEASRTIMKLSSFGTLSALDLDGWPLVVGVRFVVDARGVSALCLDEPRRFFKDDVRSSFHVAFQQSGSRTPQCTLLGSLSEPDDELLLKDGMWVNPLDYVNAEPDPLRNFAEKIVDELNTRQAEEFLRLSNIYADTGFPVTDTKMIWVDRLGFDLYLYSGEGVYAAHVPFPKEVTNEKGVKSSFYCMPHLAWEIEKSYAARDFKK